MKHYLTFIITSKDVFWCADQTNLLTKHVDAISHPDDGAICSTLNSIPKTVIIISHNNFDWFFTQIWNSQFSPDDPGTQPQCCDKV